VRHKVLNMLAQMMLNVVSRT